MPPSTWNRIWTVFRLVAALAIAAAVVAQAIQSITGAIQNGRHVVTIVSNFFSFFTILSNILAVLVLLWAVLWFWSRGRRSAAEPRALAFALASVTTYMIVTGIVYNLLLRGYQLEPGAVVPWSNEILHLAGPLFLLLDLFFGPRRRRLGWGSIVGILIFPLAWVLYTLVRASFITNPSTGDPWWYPYPFLDPHRNDGAAMLMYIGGIAVGIALVAFVVVWVGRLRGRRAASTDAEPAVVAAAPPLLEPAVVMPVPVVAPEIPLVAGGTLAAGVVTSVVVAEPEPEVEAEIIEAEAETEAEIIETESEVVEPESITPPRGASD